jgi:hypothetical protein
MQIEQLTPYYECTLSRLGYAFKIKMIILNDFGAEHKNIQAQYK